jgi:hypothetical protein
LNSNQKVGPGLAIASESETHSMVETLVNVSLRILNRLYDANSHQFYARLLKRENELLPADYFYRFTLISLLGLNRYMREKEVPDINLNVAIQACIDRSKAVDNIGDVGLLLWLCANAMPEELERILYHLNIDDVLKRLSDFRKGMTMELAWFLTGMTYSYLCNSHVADYSRNIIFETYYRLLRNQQPNGLFNHSQNPSPVGKLRSHLASFADQVYPIYALALFGETFAEPEALNRARVCAEKICKLQGPLGQWWWHYDSRAGKTVGYYPVYSVHQDSMAPMALLKLGDVCGIDFSENIYRGVRWVFGNNEIGESLIDDSEGIIWRRLHSTGLRRYGDELLNVLGISRNFSNPANLTIQHECWSYHPGWILYAFSGRS